MKKILGIVIVSILVITGFNLNVKAEPNPTSEDYLCITAEESGSIKLVNNKKTWTSTIPTIQYSKNKTTWTNVVYKTDDTEGTNITVSKGDKVYFKGDNSSGFNNSIDNNEYIYFFSTKKFSVSGNVMSLIDSSCSSTTIPNDDCFTKLFSGCSKLISINNLKLPATTIKKNCYARMFEDCEKITSIPAGFLPATNLFEGCYMYMFSRCFGLTTLPANLLQATNLAKYCYAGMFNDCNHISEIPANFLPATTLKENCYMAMFSGCSNLGSLPSDLLPATNLTGGKGCYNSMFLGCLGLTTLPKGLLPATTLEESCYTQMFYNCANLYTIPSDLLPATTLTKECYESMFFGCTVLGTLPELKATTLQEECYKQMFDGCGNIKLSTEKTGGYQLEYKVPTSGTGSTPTPTGALDSMFANTGGTFKGTPTINTTYYFIAPVTRTIYWGVNSDNELHLSSFDFAPSNSWTETGSTDGNFDSSYDQPWYNYGATITKVIVDDVIAPARTYDWFDGLSALEEADLNNLYTYNVKNMANMFFDCEKLETIHASNYFVINDSDDLESSDGMFGNCTSLVGGNGTKYDSDITDATYARKDANAQSGGTEPGYFTSNHKLILDDNGTDADITYPAQDLQENENYKSLQTTITGFNNISWNTSPDGTGTTVTTSMKMGTADTRIYLIATPNEYTVSYDSNGGEGTMSDQAFKYNDKTQKLSANTFTKSGYYFMGWSLDKDATYPDFEDEQEKPNVSSEDGATPTLYAIWWDIRRPTPSPDNRSDNSCEKVIGPTWHWNNKKGICEDTGVVKTFTR